MKTVDFFGTQVSRLILGDNPVNGHSYINDVIPGSEMMDYYTAENLLRLLRDAEALGVSGFLGLANDYILRVWRQYKREGGKMNMIFQPYPVIELERNIPMMLAQNPLGIYHQGTTTDYLIETGQFEKVKDNLKLLRDTGLPVGMGSHVPEHIMRAEEENWGVDFYMTCLYNARNGQRGQQSGFITGKSKELVFYPDDRYIMFDLIKKIPKPCLAFKLLAGGQVFYGHDKSEYRKIAEETLREVYANIKPTDIGVIGVFQRDTNQILEDVEIVNSILENA